MPRIPQVNSHKTQGFFYFNYKGKKYSGKDRQELQDKLDQLLNGSSLAGGNGSVRKDITIQTLVRNFLKFIEESTSEGTAKYYERPLKLFVKHCGPNTAVSTLKPSVLTLFLKKHFTKSKRTGKPVSPNTHLQGIRSVRRLFNWALEEEIVSVDPFKKFKVGNPVASEDCITREQVEALLKYAASADEDYYDLIRFIALSGCRVWEARKLEVGHVNLKEQTAKLSRELTKRYEVIKKQRVLFLTPELVDILSKNMERRKKKTDLVFQTKYSGQKDGGWTPNCFAARKKVAAKHLGFTVPPMRTLRPFFVTEALLAGVQPTSIATVLGHQNLNMVMQIYNKLGMHTQFLQNEVAKVQLPSFSPSNPSVLKDEDIDLNALTEEEINNLLG